MKTINVDNDFEFILLVSMRYSIGRSSYAPSLVIEYIKKHWDDISENCKYLLQRDLQYEIDQADRGLKSKIYKYDPLGSKYDRDNWKNLNDWMLDRIES